MPFPGLFDPELNKQGIFDPEINRTGAFDREYVSSPAPIGSVVNGTFLCLTIAFSTLPSSVCLPWAGSDDLLPTPTATIVEEEPWIIPGVPVVKPVAKLLSWGQEQEVVTLTIDESEYLAGSTKSKWINPSLQLARGIDEDVTIITIDESEYLPGAYRLLYHPLPIISVDDEVVSSVLFTDEGELLPRVLPIRAITKLLDWGQDQEIEIPTAVAFEDDSWLPPIRRPIVDTQLLIGTSGPTSAVVSLVDEFEWLCLARCASLWHPTIVSEPSSEWLPTPTFPAFEEDSWLPPIRRTVTNIQLLCGTSGPTSATVAATVVDEEPQLIALVPPPVTYAITQWSYGTEDTGTSEQQDDTYWLQLSKLSSLWHPTIVSDSTDYPIPFVVVSAIEENPQLVVLIPPPVTYAVAQWSYGAEDIGQVPLHFMEEHWRNPVKPVIPYLDARFVSRYDEARVAGNLISADDDFKISLVPRQVLHDLPLWSKEQNETVVPAPIRIDEDYLPVYVSRVRGRVLFSPWAFDTEFTPDSTFCYFTPTLPGFDISVPVDPVFAQDAPADPSFSVDTPATPTLTPNTPVDPTFTGDTPANPRCDD